MGCVVKVLLYLQACSGTKTAKGPESGDRTNERVIGRQLFGGFFI